MSTQTPSLSSSSSSTCHGRLVYGVRRLRPGAKTAFTKDFEAWLSYNPRLSVALAFPDPSDIDLLHLLFWDTDATKGDSLVAPGPESDAFVDGDADTVFRVYGSGEEGGSASSSMASMPHSTSQHVHRLAALAGYMRPGQPTSASATALPLIGVFRRAIHHGRRDDLARAFQRVCAIWHATVPGILAAMVTPDPVDDDYVHDIRIFADKASYDAHVDKSNAELTAAMEDWFSHYDTSIPHKGAMFAEDTSDPAMHTSSVKERPVKVDFNVFHYGRGGCMGRCLDVKF